MFALDSLVLDLVFPADTKLNAQHLIDGLGGEDVLKTRTVVDPDARRSSGDRPREAVWIVAASRRRSPSAWSTVSRQRLSFDPK